MINCCIKIVKFNICCKVWKKNMYHIFRKNWDKTKFIILSGFIVLFLFLLTVVYQNDQVSKEKTLIVKNTYEVSDLKTLTEFILSKIESPYTTHTSVKILLILQDLKKNTRKIYQYYQLRWLVVSRPDSLAVNNSNISAHLQILFFSGSLHPHT